MQNSLRERLVSEILRKVKLKVAVFFPNALFSYIMHTWGHHRVKIPSGGAVFHCPVFVQRVCSLLWQDLIFVSPLIRMT